MGCDIHIAIQVQEKDGRWVEVPYVCSWRDGPAIAGFHAAPAMFDGRNYNLFAVLADVRNGYGFAGSSTGELVRPIAAGRGFPPGFDSSTVGVDPEFPEDGPRFMGDHSFTWVGLDELEAYPWDDVTRRGTGLVTTMAALIDADLERAAEAQAGWAEYAAGAVDRVCRYCRCAECRCDDPADEDVSDREENIQRAAWRDMDGVSP